MKYEPVIGLEVHAQIKTKSKIFCGCATEFRALENENTCPVCTGMPGSLPVLNKQAVEAAIKMALVTKCTVHETSIFSRKNYFYPDLPKGYQISQYDKPLATAGLIEFECEGKPSTVRLHRIHMEEDAGKNVHGISSSYVNLNRAGVALIEIVSEADIRSASQAGEYLKTLRSIVRYLDVSDGNMDEGSFRCDVNISIRPKGQEKFGTRAEIKNLNSFKFVESAIAYEIDRQAEILDKGEKVEQETRLWDEKENKTYLMRSKADAHDYRYFPEPDLMPLQISKAWVDDIKKDFPELSDAKRKRFVKEYKLSEYDASLLVQEKSLAKYFEAVVKICKAPKLASNWILSELLREFDADKVSGSKIEAKHLGELIFLIQKGTISGKIAKTVFEKMLSGGKAPSKIVEEEGLIQVSDEANILPWIEAVLKENPKLVEEYKKGATKKFGFFVGQVMKKSHGKANPAKVNEILKKKLSS